MVAFWSIELYANPSEYGRAISDVDVQTILCGSLRTNATHCLAIFGRTDQHFKV